jgi:16S rRNA (guanine(966)-N(2))-methyltransferase RsmD
MRIIAGTLRGRRLNGPGEARRGKPAPIGFRPTSDSLRETLFNVIGPSIAGARVLDGFAGTGAVGLEAISRGAAHVTFVEREAQALAVLRDNVVRCGVEEVCAIVGGDFASFASRQPKPGPFSFVFLDPPYEMTSLEPLLAVAASVAAPEARLVLEHSSRTASPEGAPGWRRTRVLTAGDSALSFYSA